MVVSEWLSASASADTTTVEDVEEEDVDLTDTDVDLVSNSFLVVVDLRDVVVNEDVDDEEEEEDVRVFRREDEGYCRLVMDGLTMDRALTFTLEPDI